MVQVFHNSDFFDFGMRTTHLPDPAKLTLVARVDTNELDDAYRLTNHIDSDWQENPGVEAVGDAGKGARSTSVGDVLEMNDGYWMVASFGFTPMKKVLVCDRCGDETNDRFITVVNEAGVEPEQEEVRVTCLGEIECYSTGQKGVLDEHIKQVHDILAQQQIIEAQCDVCLHSVHWEFRTNEDPEARI
jgi:hypothetical protein